MESMSKIPENIVHPKHMLNTYKYILSHTKSSRHALWIYELWNAYSVVRFCLLFCVCVFVSLSLCISLLTVCWMTISNKHVCLSGFGVMQCAYTYILLAKRMLEDKTIPSYRCGLFMSFRTLTLHTDTHTIEFEWLVKFVSFQCNFLVSFSFVTLSIWYFIYLYYLLF